MCFWFYGCHCRCRCRRRRRRQEIEFVALVIEHVPSFLHEGCY